MWRHLGYPTLLAIEVALREGRLGPPYACSSLRPFVPDHQVEAAWQEFRSLDADGMTPRHIARMLQAIASERADAQAITDRLELVWSGPEVAASSTRDTAVVAHQLFREATRRIIVASYAIDKGAKAQVLFGPLGERMDAHPELEVTFFLNIQRPFNDETPEAVLQRQFADHFRDEVWPGQRLPVIYHDPRALAIAGNERACLHAKCIIADDELAFISSANLTEAAQTRNIEAGVLVRDATFAKTLAAQFDRLVDQKNLRKLSIRMK